MRMVTMENPKYEDLCRLCATKTTMVLAINIFENEGAIRQISKKIDTCLPVQVHESDELPKMICENCLYKLELFCDFRDRSARTERLLMELYKELVNHTHNEHQQTCMIPLVGNEMIMVHQQLLHNVSEVHSTPLVERDGIMVEHGIILAQSSNVDITSHSLDSIDLDNQNLNNQDHSNHSLHHQDSVMVDSNSHAVQDSGFAENLSLMQHHHLLSDEFRLHNELQLSIGDGNSMNIPLNELKTNTEEENQGYNLTEKFENHNICDIDCEDTKHLRSSSDLTEMEPQNSYMEKNSPYEAEHQLKREDSSSAQSLHVDEHFNDISSQNSRENKQVYGLNMENGEDLLILSGNKDYYCCNIYGKSYEQKTDFKVHYDNHLCSICLAVFANMDVLNSHRKEAHGGCVDESKLKDRADENLRYDISEKLDNHICDIGYEETKLLQSDSRLTEMQPRNNYLERKIKYKAEQIKHKDTSTGVQAIQAGEHMNDIPAQNAEADKNIYNLNIGNNEPLLILSSIKDYYCCNICGKSYEQKTDFEVHYENHFYKCAVCLAVFTNMDVLNSHRKEAHGACVDDPKPIKTRLKRATIPVKHKNDLKSDSEFSEAECDISQLDEEEIDETEHPDDAGDNKRKKWSPKKCKECGKMYKTNYKLAEHMRKHTGEKPYKCKSCEKAFRSKIGLAQHEAKHTGQYDFSCPTCGKGFQCKSYLMVHQRVHSTLKPFPCTTCGQNFKTKQSLLDHTNRHLGVKPYMCDVCGRGFITKGLCRAHQKIHSGLDNRKYSCKICAKMFVSKSYLQTHLRIHTGEKPFMCEVCGKGFLTRVDLKIHSTMHTGEKSYVCEMCGKAFARRDALRCHRRSHTGERPYSCDLCGQTFTQFTPMAIHKRLHTGERPYSCESCGKAFVSRSTMMTHSKKHLR